MTAPAGGGAGAPPATSAPPKTTGGGCLKGCLVGCLGLTVLGLVAAGGAWYGWHRWGHPWLARKERAVTRLVPAGLLPGHGGGADGGTPTGIAALVARRLSPAGLVPKLPATAGDTGRAAIPRDLWLPRAAGPAAYDTQPGGASVAVVDVPGASVLGLVAEARRGMKARGWTLVRAGQDGTGTALDFRRPGAGARIGLYPRRGAVEVWARRQASGAGPRAGSGGRSARSSPGHP